MRFTSSWLAPLAVLVWSSIANAAPEPPTPSFGAAIDGFASYVGQTTCDPSEKPGVAGFRDLLLDTYPGTRNLGIIRGCSVGGTSEHKEGRAFDWGVNYYNGTERDIAYTVIDWLLKTDQHGNACAIARRFGVMYMIWNRQIWSAYRSPNGSCAASGWSGYSGSNPHTDHVHLSFSWAGARKDTTWWDGGGPVCTPHTEVCNGKDDDCDGQVDENATAEVCNGKDDDCDGKIDEDLVRTCGSDVGECKQGHETCNAGKWGACEGAIGPQTEACDELDNDCDGETDDEQVCELEEAWQAALFDSGNHSDINGDGGADLCALSESGISCALSRGNRFDPTPEVNVFDADLASPGVFSTLRVGDVSGDGRADVCLRLPEGVRCWQGTDTGLGDAILGPELSDAKGWGKTEYFSAVRLADIDGDEKADLCARGKDGLACYPSRGTSFGDARILTALSDAAGFDDVNRYGTLRLGDVDGDGKSDVCAREAQGMACWLATDSGFVERIAGPGWSDEAGWSDWHNWSTIRLADVNGDGRSDLCARENEALRCYLFDGTGFTERLDGPALPAPLWDTRTALASIRMADLDGDGKSDVCVRSEQGLDCWLATDTGFDRRVLGPALAETDGWALPQNYRTLRLGDINGDNRADICGRSRDGIKCWPYEGGGFGWEVSGPQWSDGAGWDLPERYHSIRLSGVLGGGEVGTGGAGGMPHGNGGGAGAASGGAASGGAGGDATQPSSCSIAAHTGNSQQTSWIGLMSLLSWGLLRRRGNGAKETRRD
ncbi:MAG: VCBS repeat-containing protein [Polyangiaceae bacterium]|nr:VCBS repeat-containing protein [Polyangiaceae bacterium]